MPGLATKHQHAVWSFSPPQFGLSGPGVRRDTSGASGCVEGLQARVAPAHPDALPLVSSCSSLASKTGYCGTLDEQSSSQTLPRFSCARIVSVDRKMRRPHVTLYIYTKAPALFGSNSPFSSPMKPLSPSLAVGKDKTQTKTGFVFVLFLLVCPDPGCGENTKPGPRSASMGLLKDIGSCKSVVYHSTKCRCCQRLRTYRTKVPVSSVQSLLGSSGPF